VRLKKLQETERSNFAKVRAAYAADLKTRTELEIMLRQVVEDVRVNIVRHRKLAHISANAMTQSTPNLHAHAAAHQLPKLKGIAAASADPQPFEASELTQEDRERVIEVVVSQERVVALLYKKAFTASRATPTPSGAVVDASKPDASDAQQNTSATLQAP
jgi:hypothetical protein